MVEVATVNDPRRPPLVYRVSVVFAPEVLKTCTLWFHAPVFNTCWMFGLVDPPT
jgi:hypothetical protein